MFSAFCMGARISVVQRCWENDTAVKTFIFDPKKMYFDIFIPPKQINFKTFLKNLLQLLNFNLNSYFSENFMFHF